MYSTEAVSRPELNEFLEQGIGVDKLFIAQSIFPVHGVGARAGRYPRIRLADGNLLRRGGTKRGPKGTYNEVERKHGWDNYDTEDRGLEERIDDDKASEMKSFFDLEVITTRLVGRMTKIDFEINAAETLFDQAVLAHENAGTSYTKANLATLDFPEDLLYAIEKLIERGTEVNTVLMSRRLFRLIRQSTKLKQYIYAGDTAAARRMISLKDLETAFSDEAGVALKFKIASATYDTSDLGSTAANLQPIWPSSHIFVGNVSAGDFSAGGIGRTLTWNEASPSGLFTTETYRDNKRRSDMVRVRSYSQEKIIDENCGQLIVTGSDL